MRDHYRTLLHQHESRLKVERSEFLGIAFPIATEEEFFAHLKHIEKAHFDATHHCWAFRLLADERARSADAGEPSGTAGKPILSAIEGADLFNVGVAVVRWFGGVKLGTGGLSRAYRESATTTLREARVVDRFVYQRLRVEVAFPKFSAAHFLVDPPRVVIAGNEFEGTTPIFLFDVMLSRVDDFRRALAERGMPILP